MERKFGRIPSSIDRRDYNLRDFIPERFAITPRKERKWEFPCVALDQEETSHCVGFSMAHFGINLPTFTKYTKKEAHELYYKCKVIDGDPKGENGTTIRSAARVLKDIGAIDSYAFAREIQSIKWWLLNKGPLIVGTIWTEGMMKPGPDLRLDISGFVLGGHAYIINGILDNGDFDIKNSWGPDWGDNGRAVISSKDFEALFSYGGEALAAVELENYRVSKDPWYVTLWKQFIEMLSVLFE
jgi:hypothetical protein